MIAGMIIKIKYFDFFAFTPKSFKGLLLLIINFLFIVASNRSDEPLLFVFGKIETKKNQALPIF